MANFGTRLAYPRPTAPAAVPATATPALGGRLRRAVRALLRSIDDAPFDLAWPPTYRRWPMPEQSWRADQPAAAAIVERTERRRAA